MAGFFRRLFGGGAAAEDDAGGAGGAGGAVASERYRDLLIEARPQRDGAQWRVAGSITRTGADGSVQRHDFIRADVFADREEAARFSLLKGRLIADQSGDALFRD